jgi:tRNA U34 5-carboxymethylaminomethyl modifying enzyme MnmG/GidA
MADYIIDATTKGVLRGDPHTENYHIYRLTFVKTSAKKEFSLKDIELENEVDLKAIFGGLTDGFADLKDALVNARARMVDDVTVGIMTLPKSDSEVILRNAFKHQENIDKLKELLSQQCEKDVNVTLINFPVENAKVQEEKGVKTTNCPNCGAPTDITSTGRCPYCDSVIVTKQYDWVLDNLERPQ